MVEEVESWAKRMLLPLMEKMRDVTSQEENVNVTLRVQMCEGCHGTNHSCTNPVLCVPWLSQKLPWFSQHYTPTPGLLVCPSPQDHSSPRNSWESVWQDKITMDCWSYQPLESLQALVNAACGCNLVTSSLRESSSSTQSPWKTKTPDTQVSRTPGWAYAYSTPPPFTPSSPIWGSNPWSHTNLSCNSLSPEAFLLRHQRNANAKQVAFLELFWSSKYSITHSPYHRVYHQQSQLFSLQSYSHRPWLLAAVYLAVLPMAYPPPFTIQDLYELFSLPLLWALTVVQILCLPPFSPKEPFSVRLGWYHNSSMESYNCFLKKMMGTDQGLCSRIQLWVWI